MSDWKTFGYDTDAACEICGRRPAKEEPRFFYAVCERHFMLTPVEVSNRKED